MLNTKLSSTNNELTNIDHSFSNQPVMEGKQPNPASTSRKPTDAGHVEHRSDGLLTQNTSANGTGGQIHHTVNYGNQHVSNTYVGQPLCMSRNISRDLETNDQSRNRSMYKYGPIKPANQMPVNNPFSQMG